MQAQKPFEGRKLTDDLKGNISGVGFK